MWRRPSSFPLCGRPRHDRDSHDRRHAVDAVLKGKVALVTGAGTGLGRGIAQALAEAGADIAVGEIDAASAATAAGELAALGVRARAYPTDVSKSDQVDRTFA